MPDFSESHDFLNNSPALRLHGQARVMFDPSLQSHLDSFDVFLKTGNWGSIHFLVETPYTDVPMTVLMKFAMYNQSVTRETEAERQVRFGRKILVKAVPEETREQKVERLKATNARLKAA